MKHIIKIILSSTFLCVYSMMYAATINTINSKNDKERDYYLIQI